MHNPPDVISRLLHGQNCFFKLITNVTLEYLYLILNSVPTSGCLLYVVYTHNLQTADLIWYLFPFSLKFLYVVHLLTHFNEHLNVWPWKLILGLSYFALWILLNCHCDHYTEKIRTRSCFQCPQQRSSKRFITHVSNAPTGTPRKLLVTQKFVIQRKVQNTAALNM